MPSHTPSLPLSLPPPSAQTTSARVELSKHDIAPVQANAALAAEIQAANKNRSTYDDIKAPQPYHKPSPSALALTLVLPSP